MKLTGLVALYNLATILLTKWGIAMICNTENCKGTASLIDHILDTEIYICAECYMKKHYPKFYKELLCKKKQEKGSMSLQSFQKRKTFKGYPLNVIPLKK